MLIYFIQISAQSFLQPLELLFALIDLFMLQSINILKAHGKSAKESYLLNGYALNSGRAAQGMPTKVTPARIACLDFNLQKTKMETGVQVLVSDPKELEKIRQRFVHYSVLQFIVTHLCYLRTNSLLFISYFF